jgi:excisionase family DNA binding protein
MRRLFCSIQQSHLRRHPGEQPRGQANMSAQEAPPNASVGPIAVSPAEAARLAGVGRTTIYAAISSGELSSLKLGKRRLIVVTALRAWLQAHEVAP